MSSEKLSVKVEVKNLEKLQELLNQAQKESAQLAATIEQIKNFELEISV